MSAAEIVNHPRERAAGGERVFYDIHTEAEKAAGQLDKTVRIGRDGAGAFGYNAAFALLPQTWGHRHPTREDGTMRAKPADAAERERRHLCAKLLALLPEEGRIETGIEGLALTRYDGPSPAVNCFYRPMLALVAQGFKHSQIGAEECSYGAGRCVVVGVDMPGVFHIGAASREAPFLSLSLTLNRYTVAKLLEEMPPGGHTAGEAKPVVPAPAGPELLAACGRLLDVLSAPEKITVLAPLVVKEIHFHLLTGPQGDCLRLFCSRGTQTANIAEAIGRLRGAYAEPLNMEDLAGQVGMSRSSFNRHFRRITGLSPLQFQKRLRLYEAERLMLFEGHNAGAAALAVGYESASQFTREYKRLFGQPPRRDVAGKRA